MRLMSWGWVLVVVGACMPWPAMGGELPGWVNGIRADHPRLFFNADTWPAVRARALGEEKEWYARTKELADKLMAELEGVDQPEVRDLGKQAAWAAFVYLMTEDVRYRDLAKQCLDTSLRYYDLCFEERRAVDWYSTTRVHAALAWDWLFNDLTEAERKDYLGRLVRAVDRVLKAKPPIYRENISDYKTGFYGVKNCQWFIGCTGYGTGIEPDLVQEWLVWGYDENLRLLEHRKKACGDDGGGASPVLDYVFGAYPWAEQNFLYTWQSATGENIASAWPHAAWLANYVIWNWIASDDEPFEFGYGDTPHIKNRLATWSLNMHMANIRQLYAKEAPEAAALARHVQDILPEKNYSSAFFIYPFLWTGLGDSPESYAPEDLPHARNFENMGQVFMRSGTGPEDTYGLFSCGGILAQHRHYDALHFTIYHRGFLALDSGTRHKQSENGQHLANYYAQTVAHNCVLIHQPGEPPARYWGGTVESNYGGQHKQLGSVTKAFETNDDYVYVAGDATASYQHGGETQKCRLATRQIVFLLPNHFVIFDRVTATKPEFRKEWLIHTAHEPVLEGKAFRADHGDGRMFCRTLLPGDAALAAVGGPDKAFWAAGQNWVVDKGDLTDESMAMMGQWRVEVSPGSPREEDVFLHVIQAGGQDLAEMDEVALAGEHGVRVAADGVLWKVEFNAEGELGGHIRCQERGIDRALATTVQPQAGIRAEEG